jgi:hypothetical protein
VAGNLEDLEHPAAEVDPVSVGHAPGLRPGPGPEPRRIRILWRALAEALRPHFSGESVVGESPGVRAGVRGVHGRDPIELRVAPHVIEVRVRVQDLDGKPRELLDHGTDGNETESGVEHQRALGPHDEIGDHLLELIGLGDREDAVGGPVDLEPAGGDVHARKGRVGRAGKEVAPPGRRRGGRAGRGRWRGAPCACGERSETCEPGPPRTIRAMHGHSLVQQAQEHAFLGYHPLPGRTSSRQERTKQ